MKAKLFFVLVSFFLLGGCSSAKIDRFEALNDFLETKIKDETEKIIVIKEKESPEETIKIFYGGSAENPDTQPVQFPIYNEKDWLKMKDRYVDKRCDLLGISDYWNENDFRHKKIELVNGIEFWEKLKSIYLSSKYDARDKSINKVFAFSMPIIYKKKYLTFFVSEGDNDFSPISHSNKYIVVMEKIKGKWVVIEKAWSRIYS